LLLPFFVAPVWAEERQATTRPASAIASLTDPAKLNRAKSDKVTERARVFAKELCDAGLLSEEGWKRVESCFSPKVLRE
jgi:hypothetical protein